jgi:hypothetical protein
MPRIWLERMAEMQEICATLGHFRYYSEEPPRCLHVCWLVVCQKRPDINVRRLLIRDADFSPTIRLRVSRFLQSDLR